MFTKDDVGKRLVDGKLVDLPDVEKTAETDRWNAAEVQRPMREWQREIASHDGRIPRSLEDVIDALPQSTRDRIAPETLRSYNDKKAVRARRPK